MTNSVNHDQLELLTPRDVSRLMGIAPATLAIWRCTGRQRLPYVKLGKLVRYYRRDVEAFLRDRERDG